MYPSLLHHFFDLIFPSVCLACDRPLVSGEPVLCTACLCFLPSNATEMAIDRQVRRKFLGEIVLDKATALFTFTKKGPVQRMIHKIKYYNKSQAARIIGRYYGNLWRRVYCEDELPNMVIPVPLHPKRIQERGYNQSERIAQGMADILSIPCKKNWLCRRRYTTTQTKKTKMERRANVQGAFSIATRASLDNGSVLLIDDLVTTGATLKACAHTLLEAGVRRLSIAVLAVAVQ